MTEHQPHSRNLGQAEPAYVVAWRTGELQKRAERAIEMLADCKLCPRRCGVDRIHDELRLCRTGRYAPVGSYGPHYGEERCLSGSQGSGTVFFANCN